MDIELAKKFFMSMGFNMHPIKVEGNTMELGGALGGHYTITQEGGSFRVERINHHYNRKDGHYQTEVELGMRLSLAIALTTVYLDVCEGMAHAFFEGMAEELYSMPEPETLTVPDSR